MAEGRHHPSFSHPIFRKPTGKLQFRIDGMSAAKTDRGTVTRGEVIAVGNPEYAAGLVDSGQFAHIAASTPIGKPQTSDDYGDIAE